MKKNEFTGLYRKGLDRNPLDGSCWYLLSGDLLSNDWRPVEQPFPAL